MSVPNPATTKWVPLWNTGATGGSGGLITGDLVWSVLAARPGAIPCDGALYNSVTDNTFAALYAAIGTTYGGTGPTSFAVPDVRGRLLISRGPNADVNTLGKNDGDANPANRTPLHYHAATGLSWAGSFAGAAGNTGTESADHAHYTESDTGYVSSDHSHAQDWLYWQAQGYGTDVYPHVAAGMAAGLNLGWQNAQTHGINANHTHHYNAWSGGRNAAHVHAYTPAGSVSGAVGGAVGASGPRPADTPSYIVENCFIVK